MGVLIKKLCIISTALDVTEGIFVVLHVSIYGPYTFSIKRQFFFAFIINNS